MKHLSEPSIAASWESDEVDFEPVIAPTPRLADDGLREAARIDPRDGARRLKSPYAIPRRVVARERRWL